MEIDIADFQQIDGFALVLDDSMTARHLVGDALSKMGLKVLEAKDGSDGIEKLNDLYAMYKDEL